MRERVSLEECQVGLIRGESEESEGGSNENSCVCVFGGRGMNPGRGSSKCNGLCEIKFGLFKAKPPLLLQRSEQGRKKHMMTWENELRSSGVGVASERTWFLA